MTEISQHGCIGWYISLIYRSGISKLSPFWFLSRTASWICILPQNLSIYVVRMVHNYNICRCMTVVCHYHLCVTYISVCLSVRSTNTSTWWSDSKRVQCITSIEYLMFSVFFADPCDGFKCPQDLICQLNLDRKPNCRCGGMCAYDLKPVCGSDGRTYSNDCLMRVEACKSSLDIFVLFNGACKDGEWKGVKIKFYKLVSN